MSLRNHRKSLLVDAIGDPSVATDIQDWRPDSKAKRAPTAASTSIAVADALPDARRRTLPGQTHDVAQDVLASAVAEFFAN